MISGSLVFISRMSDKGCLRKQRGDNMKLKWEATHTLWNACFRWLFVNERSEKYYRALSIRMMLHGKDL